MVFGRWLGDAGFFDESGAILSIGFWLYILGELYFGVIPDRRNGSPTNKARLFLDQAAVHSGVGCLPDLAFC